MLRSFSLLVVSLALSVVTIAAAPPRSADAFLHGIYAHYQGDDRTTGKGIFLDKPSDIHRYFADDLADLMIADDAAAEKRGDVPQLDGDPFVDAQDWDIKDIAIHIDFRNSIRRQSHGHVPQFQRPVHRPPRSRANAERLAHLRHRLERRQPARAV